MVGWWGVRGYAASTTRLLGLDPRVGLAVGVVLGSQLQLSRRLQPRPSLARPDRAVVAIPKYLSAIVAVVDVVAEVLLFDCYFVVCRVRNK